MGKDAEKCKVFALIGKLAGRQSWQTASDSQPHVSHLRRFCLPAPERPLPSWPDRASHSLLRASCRAIPVAPNLKVSSLLKSWNASSCAAAGGSVTVAWARAKVEACHLGHALTYSEFSLAVKIDTGTHRKFVPEVPPPAVASAMVSRDYFWQVRAINNGRMAGAGCLTESTSRLVAASNS